MPFPDFLKLNWKLFRFRFKSREQSRGVIRRGGGRRPLNRFDRGFRNDKLKKNHFQCKHNFKNNINNETYNAEKLPKPKWNLSNLQPFKKNFYTPHRDISNRSNNEINQYRNDMAMTIIGKDIPYPITRFQEANFPDYIMNVIRWIKKFLFFKSNLTY